MKGSYFESAFSASYRTLSFANLAPLRYDAHVRASHQEGAQQKG